MRYEIIEQDSKRILDKLSSTPFNIKQERGKTVYIRTITEKMYCCELKITENSIVELIQNRLIDSLDRYVILDIIYPVNETKRIKYLDFNEYVLGDILAKYKYIRKSAQFILYENNAMEVIKFINDNIHYKELYGKELDPMDIRFLEEGLYIPYMDIIIKPKHFLYIKYPGEYEVIPEEDFYKNTYPKLLNDDNVYYESDYQPGRYFYDK